MKRHGVTILVFAAAFLVLSACGGGEVAQKAAVDIKAAPAAVPAPAAAAVAAPAAPAAGTKVAEAEDEPPPPLTVPRGYRYEPRGRRDPFVNPQPKPVGAAAEVKPTIRPDGLPGVLVSEVKVSGIIYSPEPTMKKAMLSAGKKTYFAAQGDSLFDGVIKEIRPNEVVFTMLSTATKQPVNKETTVPTGGSSATLAGEKK